MSGDPSTFEVWLRRGIELVGVGFVCAGAWVLSPWVGLAAIGGALVLLANFGWTEYGETIEPEGEPRLEERLTQLRRPIIPRLSRTGTE